MKKKPTRADIARDVRFCFGDEFTVRQGVNYIGCRCKRCGRIFQVAYFGFVHRYARNRLSDHVRTECIFRNCGPSKRAIG